ncbi:hypothetical protein FUA26_15230 [Seonamhaeicola algicola]|uniref:T9SS C-terminal target domain-containing protein n=1 Tax=Seonamhaeicola algicola TaxID=1719036 RepID=A0A5C7ABY7_9FLAO|nr:hypothetical protein [Seonamhaeicola algicola]TXE06320.1 hypothetical protein FUA26_15230 [Seonamhaeicola algicola]
MKIKTTLTYLLLLFCAITYAQQERGITGDDNWLDYWAEFNPKTVKYGEPNYILTGSIEENMTLTKRNVYLLSGNVFVTNNATLTIEPGTIILGDVDSKATLTITSGSKIMAQGTETDPIVFTSSSSFKKAGDWGGIIVLGNAPTNKLGKGSAVGYYPSISGSDYAQTLFGGTDADANSGVFKYVRIEYAGKKTKQAKSSNALTLAAVGNKTHFENVIVSFSGANAINVVGGSFNMAKIVSYKSKGSDYSFNTGAQVNISNSLAVRSPYISGSSVARCINVLSFDKNKEAILSDVETTVVAKNMTVLTDTKDLEFDLKSGLIREAIYVGANTRFKIENSVVSGFSKAAILDENIKLNTVNLEKIQFVNSYFNKCIGNIYQGYSENNEDLENWYGNPIFQNLYSKGIHSETFIKVDGNKPDYRLRIEKIIAMRKN